MNDKDFIAYEYKTRSVKAADLSKLIDMYEAFGWEITGTQASAGGNTTLSMKRDRKQKHKQELARLERQAEETYTSIVRLRAAKTSFARTFAYIFGCASALVLGGGMSMVMTMQENAGFFAGGIIIGIIGMVLCGINYPVYKKIAEKKTAQVLPAIDESEEKLANILERGNDILRADII